MTTAATLHALIIEDDQTSIHVLSTLLKQRQVRITTIQMNIGSDFDPASLDQIDRPDIIFVDLEMPGTNGYRMLEHLRATPSFEGVPIVAYTTHTSHLNRAKEAGFHSFLGKPIIAANFPDNLQAILNNIPVWEIP